MNSLFPLGQMVITATARISVHPADVQLAIGRHARGDWGDLDTDDKAANDAAILELTRVFSAYHDRNGTKFYVITEHDRSLTTILLPEDY